MSWQRVGRRLALFVGVTLLAAACESGAAPESDSIAREVFVAAYVDLRAAALAGEGTLSPEKREEILARHSVSEADLLRFVDVHGRDVDYMAGVWGEAEERLQAGPPTPDTAG